MARYAFRVFFVFFALLMINSAFMFVVENKDPLKPKHTMLDFYYFMVITMSTVGFGDITPSKNLGRVLKFKSFKKIFIILFLII